MQTDFRILKNIGAGNYVPVREEEFTTLGVGGFCFEVGKHNIPFDWTAYSGGWDDKGYFSFSTGYGWMNDFELDDCYDDEYKDIGIKREDLSAEYLASVHHIEEFYIDFEIEGDTKECGIGDNTQKDAKYKLELLKVQFEDIDTGKVFTVNPVVLTAFNNGDKLCVKALTEDNYQEVLALDELSGNAVADMVDSEEYAWGLFKNDELIGYCTIGGAEELGEDKEFNYPGYSYNSLLLSDVFIKSEQRGQGYATLLVDEAIKLRTETKKELVFLTLLDDNLSHLYQKCGFEIVQPGLMVRDEYFKAFESILANAEKTCEEVNKSFASKNNTVLERNNCFE